MNNAHVFDKSFLPPMMSVLNSDYWGTVVQIYESGKRKETIHAVLDYIRPGLSAKSQDAERNKYALPHGSIMVYLEINEDKFSINAPFLQIPARSLIPLMRQVAEINFGTLVLAQIVLEGNDIFFRYEAPMEFCEPYKLYRVLEEICIQADANDDVFIEKFGAQRFSKMEVEHFTPEQLDLCYTKFRQYIEEAIAYLDYFINKRIDSFGWDALYLAFTKIDYYMRPQGVLKSEIERGIREMNSQAPLNEKLDKGRAIVQKMLAMDKEKFAESIYKSQQFISEKTKFEVAGVQNYLNRSYNTAKDEMNKRDTMGATLTMLTGIYGMLFYYNIPQSTYDILTDGLERAGGNPWGFAADILWGAYEKTMQQSQKMPNAYGLRDI